MADKKMISVILPVFNEESNIETLYQRLSTSILAICAKYQLDYEILLINDGSKDRSKEIAFKIHNTNPKWKVLSFSRNFGHQTAVSAGMYFSSGDLAAIMDADLQDPPEVLDGFIQKWLDGFEVIYAVRTKRKESALKRFAYYLFYRMFKKVASIEIALDSGDFCVMDRKVIDALKDLPERLRFVRGLRSWVGFKQIGVPFERASRFSGESKYTLSKLFNLAFDGLISFSSKPLRIAGIVGLTWCLGALFLILFLVVWKFSGITILNVAPGQAAGWTSLIALILLVSGFQLLILGIIGEYLGRMFDEIKERSPWVINEAKGFQEIQYRSSPGWYVK